MEDEDNESDSLSSTDSKASSLKTETNNQHNGETKRTSPARLRSATRRFSKQTSEDDDQEEEEEEEEGDAQDGDIDVDRDQDDAEGDGDDEGEEEEEEEEEEVVVEEEEEEEVEEEERVNENDEAVEEIEEKPIQRNKIPELQSTSPKRDKMVRIKMLEVLEDQEADEESRVRDVDLNSPEVTDELNSTSFVRSFIA